MFRKTILLVALLLAAVACRNAADTGNAARNRRVTTTTVGQPTDMGNRKIVFGGQPALKGFLDRAAIGSKLAPDGTVDTQQQSFVEGEPIYVTMRFNLSPARLQASLRVADQVGKELHRDSKEMNGQKVVTFKVPANVVAKPGTYQLQGFWGGNDACDYKIDVRPRRR